MHVTFNASNPFSTEKVVVDDADEELQQEFLRDKQDDTSHENQEKQQEETNLNHDEGTSQTLPKEWRNVFSHRKGLILGNSSRSVTTRLSLRNTCEHAPFTSQIELKSFRMQKMMNLGLWQCKRSYINLRETMCAN